MHQIHHCHQNQLLLGGAHGFKTVVNKLDENDAMAIEVVKNIISLQSLKNNLIYISSNFTIISNFIESFEKRGCAMGDTIILFENLKSKINCLTGETAEP